VFHIGHNLGKTNLNGEKVWIKEGAGEAGGIGKEFPGLNWIHIKSFKTNE